MRPFLSRSASLLVQDEDGRKECRSEELRSWEALRHNFESGTQEDILEADIIRCKRFHFSVILPFYGVCESVGRHYGGVDTVASTFIGLI